MNINEGCIVVLQIKTGIIEKALSYSYIRVPGLTDQNMSYRGNVVLQFKAYLKAQDKHL